MSGSLLSLCRKLHVVCIKIGPLTGVLITLHLLLLTTLFYTRGNFQQILPVYLPTSQLSSEQSQRFSRATEIKLPCVPAASDRDAVREPLNLHYARFKGDPKANMTLKFVDYLSVLSAVQHLKPDAIFLHGDEEPVGHYWDLMKNAGWIKFMPRNRTESMLGRIKKFPHVYHMADMMKLEILLQYGGIASDFDVYFIRGERIRTILTYNTAFVCYGDDAGHSIGIMGFSKRSRLLRAFRHAYDVIYVTDWNFNSGDVLKYLTEVFAEETYLANRVCNNPHPHAMYEWYHTFKMNWTESVAIHTYVQHSDVKNIHGPEDITTTGNMSSYREMLQYIWENRTLPPEDLFFVDRMDPLNGIEYM